MTTCGNCHQPWPCSCDDPIAICNICGLEECDCKCDELGVDDEELCAYDDGQIYAVTLGHFIGLLIDAGHDPAVIFRVVMDGPSDENGCFVRKLSVIMVPNGHVKEEIARQRADRIHKVLQALLDANVIS